nr:linear amide C-N hydrolase [Empedobacter falsenii]
MLAQEFVYKGPENTVITARSMDWKDEIDANIWVFPRGIDRSGNVGNASEKWTSKYGSVIASAWDIATTDGMNEKGLVANVLWLVESQYPQLNLVYYFETTKTPNTFWVDLKKIDFGKNAKTKRLSVSKNETYAGETSQLFSDTKPFTFVGI